MDPSDFKNNAQNSPKIKSAIQWTRKVQGSCDIEIVEPELFKDPNFIKKKFINIVSILGVARKGKSTLMNCMLGKNVFETSNDVEACTKGVWLSEVQERIDDKGVVLFADTEGEGNENIKYKVRLSAPIVVLSKVIIYNVVGVERENLLRELSIFCHISKRITLNGSPFKFGDLVIAVRDYALGGTEEKVRSHFFQEEKEDNDESIKERNKIRKQLSTQFRNIKVRLFSDPLKDKDRFEKEVNALKEEIRNRVKEPRYFGQNTRLTPENINEFMKEIVHQLTTEEAIRLESIVVKLNREEVEEARSCFKDNLWKRIDGIILPVTDIEETIKKVKNELMNKFKEVTSKVEFVSDFRDEVMEELETLVKEKLDVKRKENQREVKRVTKARTKTETFLVDKFCRIPLGQKSKQFEAKLKNIEDIVFQDFQSDIEDVPHESEYRKKTEQNLKEFFRTKNQAMVSKNKEVIRLEQATKKAETSLLRWFSRIRVRQKSESFEAKLKNIEDMVFQDFQSDIEDVPCESEYRKKAERNLKELFRTQNEEMVSKNKEFIQVQEARKKAENSLLHRFRKISLGQESKLFETKLGNIEDMVFQEFQSNMKGVPCESEYSKEAEQDLQEFFRKQHKEMVSRNEEFNRSE